jgi:rhodanese-related sulfurtransferase
MKSISISYILLISIFSMAACAQNNKTAAPESTTEQTPAIAMNINTDEFARLMQEKKDAIILDVRTDAEIAEGSIEGHTHLDFYDASFRDKLSALDRNKVVMVYCRSAGRSTDALGMMAEMGFREVYNLEGGFEAWKAAGKKVHKN